MGNPRNIRFYCTYRRDVKSEELGEKVNGPQGKVTQRCQTRRAYENLPYNGDITSGKQLFTSIFAEL